MSSPSPGVCKPSCQVPSPRGHTPSPSRTALAWARKPGGDWRAGAYLPQLLKRANREVKIGNKNKIAPAPGCLCRKHGTSGPGPSPRPSVRLHRDFALAPGPRAGSAAERTPGAGSDPGAAKHPPWATDKRLSPLRLVGDGGADPPPGTRWGGADRPPAHPHGRAPHLGRPHTSGRPPGPPRAAVRPDVDMRESRTPE